MDKANSLRPEKDQKSYYCDCCGCEINGLGKIEKFYWVDSTGRRKYTTYRLCDDCTREDIKEEVG